MPRRKVGRPATGGWPMSELAPVRRRARSAPPKWARPGRWDKRSYSFVSADTVAAAHGARVGYVWRGQWFQRVEWDLVVIACQYLLGYARRPLTGPTGHQQLMLWRSVQKVVLRWPPLESEREAIEEVVWEWSNDASQGRRTSHAPENVRRLQRARGLFEAWGDGQPEPSGDRCHP